MNLNFLILFQSSAQMCLDYCISILLQAGFHPQSNIMVPKLLLKL